LLAIVREKMDTEHRYQHLLNIKILRDHKLQKVAAEKAAEARRVIAANKAEAERKIAQEKAEALRKSELEREKARAVA
jgi:hypothetical protein